MSELRRDPLSDRWVIIAENRAGRPHEFLPAVQPRSGVRCPFCPGNEDETPPAVASYPASGDARQPSSWQVRVVPNKFPALARSQGKEEAPAGSGFFEACQADGLHEVIVESPEHVASLTAVSPDQAELTFRAYRDRLRYFQDLPRLAYGLVFKNARAEGGASLVHTHSQVIATPFVPADVQYELTKSLEYRALHGEGLFHNMLANELAAEVRIVTVTDRFVAFCPYAARLPYETWIAPRSSAAQFADATNEELAELSQLVCQTLRRLERLLEQPAYNYWIRTAPLKSAESSFHWRIEIAPRLARLAGFELGAGCFINHVCPEEAARRLRAS